MVETSRRLFMHIKVNNLLSTGSRVSKPYFELADQRLDDKQEAIRRLDRAGFVHERQNTN